VLLPGLRGCPTSFVKERDLLPCPPCTHSGTQAPWPCEWSSALPYRDPCLCLHPDLSQAKLPAEMRRGSCLPVPDCRQILLWRSIIPERFRIGSVPQRFCLRKVREAGRNLSRYQKQHRRHLCVVLQVENG